MINAEQDDRQFRRGVVLGLTMAEILLLLIFLLMLLLAASLKSMDEDLKKVTVERDAASANAAKLEKFIEKLPQGKDTPLDFWKDYQRVAQELAKANEENAALEKQNTELNDQLADAKQKTEDVKPLLDKAHELSPGASTPDAVLALIAKAEAGAKLMEGGDAQSLASCQAALPNCQGQVAYLTDRLNAKAGGRDKPPCWATPKGGEEFIFNAHIRDDGIVLVDRKLRPAEQAELPINGFIPFDSPMTVAEFRAATQKLYDWSVNHKPECRFHVLIYNDTTAATSSKAGDDMRLAIEGHFYKAEPKKTP